MEQDTNAQYCQFCGYGNTELGPARCTGLLKIDQWVSNTIRMTCLNAMFGANAFKARDHLRIDAEVEKLRNLALQLSRLHQILSGKTITS